MPKTKKAVRSDGLKEVTKVYRDFGNAHFTGRKHFYGKNGKDIEAKIKIFEDSLKNCPDAEKHLITSVIDEWWLVKETQLSPNSIPSFKAKKEEIRNRFGSIPVAELTSSQILSWLNTKAAQGLAQRGISDRKSVFKNILDFALAREYIQDNPCTDLPIVKGKSAIKRLPATEEDIQILEEHKTDSLLCRMYYFMEYTGCRIGETIVLQQKDVNRDAHKAVIHKDIAYHGNVPEVKNWPKTAAGNREIDLYDNVLEILPEYDDPETFIFFPSGLPHKSALQKQQKVFRKKYGISATAHQLRHTYAGIMHSAEIDAKDTQARMGHSSISITQDIYTEIERGHNEKIRNKANAYIMEHRLGRKKKACPHCGTFYTKSDDGHEFQFCPDCGVKIMS